MTATAPSQAELAILKHLWTAGPQSAREVQDRIAGPTGWSYSTTRTLLARMTEKGLVERQDVHGLSVFTLIMLVYGFVQARRGNIVAHRSTMISLYAFALVLTGAFTLLPGRRMHAVLFADGGTTAALLALSVGIVLLLAFWIRYRHRSSRRLIRSR